MNTSIYFSGSIRTFYTKSIAKIKSYNLVALSRTPPCYFLVETN